MSGQVNGETQQMQEAQEAQEANSKKRKRGIWRIVFWLALVVFVVAAGALAYIMWGYWSASKNYDDIASNAFTTKTTEVSSLAQLTVDWDYLRSVNPDVVAWIYIPDTNVNYPVVQGSDNEEYLHKDFGEGEGFAARGGTIFLDVQDKPNMASQNNVMYGHHMRDGSMFAVLSDDYVNQEFFDAHRTIYVLTPTMNYQCEAFSIVLTDGWDAIVETDFTSTESCTQYVQDKIERSVVEPTGGFPQASSVTKLFSFSTCDYQETNGRAVLFSRVADTAVPNADNSGSETNQDAAAVKNAAKEGA